MEFDRSPDSDVTSDDLPPAQQNKGVTGGNVTGNGCIHCAKMKTDTEIQIHQLEIEDCDSILRAIEADSEAFTWISPEDLRWEVEDSGSIDGSAQGAPDCRITESASHDDAVLDTEWRNGPVKKKSKKVFAPSQNDIINKRAHTIEILHTRSLVNEIKKVFGAKNPDPRKIEKAQKLMKEHEQSLIETIKLLDDDTSDGDSGSGKDALTIILLSY
ncbi:protein EMSY-LIKE 3-like [Canna indica]|uniref:Protein EMSY-LIKE 3-like n=1 Tax=Canna indica TaxID=4628 RepID=A0AAQ3K029_9LILI|nr:protein EMSY-LIKE 3-like [Canna indica]